MDTEQLTQPTQNAVDPRRLGQQNTGFRDEDVSDIICVLYPHSKSARQEVQRMAFSNSPYVIGRDEADTLEPNYKTEDDASRFESLSMPQGNYALMLRLSSDLKNPAAGFSFGRNVARCDVVFGNDPMHRVSNVHFRIYVNEYGTVMIQDQSTNGTFVDDTLLASRGKPTVEQRRVLSSGTKIRLCLHEVEYDITFRVRIPMRDERYEAAHLAKVMDFFTRHNIPREDGATAAHPDLFGGRPNGQTTPAKNGGFAHPGDVQNRAAAPRRENTSIVSREWTGSGKYNKIRAIGKGAFAVVYKVTSKYDGRPYAAKELEKRRLIKNGVLDQKVENEMKIMQRINHPNIVKYMENFEWDDRLFIIIMEYIPGGDLGKLIHDTGPMSEQDAKIFSVQLLSALGYLHSNNITHRDVKPDNILISNSNPYEFKLTDFGLSKVIDSEQTFLRTFCGTLLYCAPEVYNEFTEYDDNGYRTRGKQVRKQVGQRYSHAVDIWSLGGVLFYCMTGAPPYPVTGAVSYSALLHRVMTTPLNILPLEHKHVTARGVDFITRMLQRRPEHRATVLNLQEHVWLKEFEEEVQMSQSYEQLTDDEEYPNSALQDDEFGDHVSESLGEDSDHENNTMTRAVAPKPRLFGEVGSSAIGSSGAIPSSYLNLPIDDPSMGETEILDEVMEDEAYNSSDSAEVSRRPRHFLNQQEPSMYQRQSMDQLASLVEEVASQSLGNGAAPKPELVDPSASMASIFSLDPNTSKRKPPSQDNSEEWDENTPPGNPMIKRLKSETNMEGTVSDEMIEEYKLMSAVPEIRRLSTGRQMDAPLKKTQFWTGDSTTWHLDYPEFTLLQYNVFKQAAQDRGEEFENTNSPLWGLAMKHFPPTTVAQKQELARSPGRVVPVVSSSRPIKTEPTSTAGSAFSVPIQEPRGLPILTNETQGKRELAVIESDDGSSIKDVTMTITDSFISFGRGPENTCKYHNKMEAQVPKYAFKIMLWKEGFNPAANFSKTPGPWQTEGPIDAESYHFWISTKATRGIMINGANLPSYNSTSPGSSSRYWTKIYNNDVICISGRPSDPLQNRAIFKCTWGGSSRSRSEVPGLDRTSLQLATAEEAKNLDMGCINIAERRAQQERKLQREREAELDTTLRQSIVHIERARSDAFQKKRLEAIKFLNDRQPLATRKSSAGSRLTVSEPPTQYRH